MFKLISVDNEATKGNSAVGAKGRFDYDGNNFYFNHIRSSIVKSIITYENILEVQTKNSLYKFKKIQDIKIEMKRG